MSEVFESKSKRTSDMITARGERGFQWLTTSTNQEEEKRLVGKIICKAKINPIGVKEQIRAAWKLKGSVEIGNIDTNLFSFTFTEADDAKRVLRDSPWIIRNHMLSLQKRGAYVGDNEVKISTCLFWIQLHNIPPEGRILANYQWLGERIGRVIEIEDPGPEKIAARGFGRLRVEVDVEKPLIPGFYIQRPDLEESKKEPIWIQVMYEKLQRFCYLCGKLGHESKNCDLDEEDLNNVENRNRYNAKMCAPPYRPRNQSPESSFSPRTAESKVLHGEQKSVKCLHGKENGSTSYEEPAEGSKGSSKEHSRDIINDRSIPSGEKLLGNGQAEGERGNNIYDMENDKKNFQERKKVKVVMDQDLGRYINIWAKIKFPSPKPTGVHIQEIIQEVSHQEETLSASMDVYMTNGPGENSNQNGLRLVQKKSVPHSGQDLNLLVNQVEKVNLKRSAEELRESPIPKRKKTHKNESPGFAEKCKRADLILEKAANEEDLDSRFAEGFQEISHRSSESEVNQPRPNHVLEFHMGSNEKGNSSRKAFKSQSRRTLFPQGEVRPKSERGGGRPNPATGTK